MSTQIDELLDNLVYSRSVTERLSNMDKNSVYSSEDKNDIEVTSTDSIPF